MEPAPAAEGVGRGLPVMKRTPRTGAAGFLFKNKKKMCRVACELLAVYLATTFTVGLAAAYKPKPIHPKFRFGPNTKCADPPKPDMDVAISTGFVSFVLEDLGGAAVHVDPFFTLAVACFFGFDPYLVVPYLAVQLIGSLAGVYTASLAFPYGDVRTVVSPSVSPFGAVLREVFISAVSTFVRCLLLFHPRYKVFSMRGAVMASVACIMTLFSGRATGASLNAFRSMAGSVVSGDYDDAYVYWIGDLLGDLVGAGLAAIVILCPRVLALDSSPSDDHETPAATLPDDEDKTETETPIDAASPSHDETADE